MTLFHDVRLPDSVEQGAQGGPAFLTSIISMSSGVEQRNLDWSDTRNFWDVSYGIDDATTFDIVRQFFYARRGRGYAFRFRDWSDFTLNLELIGTGDGVKTDFQITKTYEASGPLPYVRKITRPDMATFTTTVNGVPTASWTYLGLGVVRYTTPPGVGQSVRVTYVEFDIPMRFEVDRFPLIVNLQNAAAVGSLPLAEIRE